jgi:hypothetical protein
VGGFIQNQTPHLKLKYKNPLIYETTISNKINRPVRNINRYKININIFKEQESKFSCEQEFVGGKAYIGANNMQTPHKKPRGGELTKEQKEENKELSSTRRIFVEHVIRLLRIFRVTQERFRLKSSTYEQIILVVCGLVRLRLGMIDLSVLT